MKDGKLKELVLDLVEESGDEYWDCKKGLDGKITRTQEDAVNQLINEAKKEFPHDLLVILKNVKTAKKYSPNYIMRFDEQMKLLNWFKKWFGESDD